MKRYRIQNSVDLETGVKNIEILFLQYEIDFNDIFVIFTCKMTYTFGFPDLPGSFDDQRFSVRIFFPCNEFVINISRQKFHVYSP